MYLLNLGPLHYHLGLLSKQAQFSAGEIVQAFRHEKKEEAIVERYLRESYLRVGGVCGCIFDYSDDEFKPSCTFHLDGDTEEVEVSFRPTMIGYRPISLLKRALLRNETVVEGIENLDDISELRPQKFNSRSYICVPVRSAFGKAFICISSTRDVFVDTITAMDIYILELLSQQLVVSLENCRLFNDLANMNQELDMKVADRTEELEKQKMELQEAKLKAEESARAKSIFLANMSHEVRTPASQIISAAELLSGTTLTVEQNGFLDIVISSGKLLLNLLNDILDVSKLDSQKLQLEYAPFNLRQLIKATVEAFTVSRPLYLAYSIDKKLPDILTGDALRLQQIFTNLISNALKFTTKGYVLLEAKMVTLQSDFDGEINEIEFSVTDTGAGISKEKLNVIFQRFEQENTSISRLHGGTGLGLSISQDLCGLMGSRLHAESDVGVGSKFYFTVRLRWPQNSAKVEQSRQLDDPKQKLLLLLANPTEYSTKSSKPLLQVQLDNCGIVDITSRNCTSAELQEISDTSQDSFDMMVLDLLSAPKELSFYITHIHRLRIPVIIICDTDQHAELPQNFESNSVHVLRHPYKQSVLEQLVLNHRKNDIRKITTNGVMANVNVNYHVDNIKILLAEDNPVNRKVMTEMFRRLGHSIDVAMNGVEATEMAALTNYDVIFMDVRMPIMSGLEATKKIIAHNESRVDWKKPIIIGLSADALQENREDGLKAGMDEYLSKPVSKDSLVNIINKLCG
ncbi:hypothetical protein BKA69DRAFT_1073197 [Paraphysoderma sedebokerense]|nr:hypothetical protein BKA69DRAFT_1073197 [Paraphysoderma sedebokerense]